MALVDGQLSPEIVGVTSEDVDVITYTPNQQAAIECVDSHLQIIACAGSGKTDVVSRRIAELLRLPDVEPANIVAFTFTEKAAAELKDRVLRRVEDGGGSAIGLAEMFIGTMHAYCLDILQSYVPETFRYRVLADIANRLLIDRHSKSSGLTSCPTSLSSTPHLRRYVHSRLRFSHQDSWLSGGPVRCESRMTWRRALEQDG